MAEPEIPAVAPVVPAAVIPEPVAAPVAAVVAAEPAAAAVEAPVAAPAAPSAAEPPKPVDIPSLLDEVGKEPPKEVAAAEAPKPGEEAKPAEAAKPGEPEKPKEGEAAKSSEVVAEAPKLAAVEYKWDAPETIKFDDAIKGEVSTALDAFRTDPTNPRPLFDQAEKMMQRYAAQVSQDQFKVFNETRKNWRTEIMADPEVGGAGYQTSMGAVARVRDAVVSNAKAGTPQHAADIKAFDEFCRVTGAGDHPVLVKMFKRMARFMDEPAPPPPGAKAPASNSVNPNRSRAERLYPNTNFGRRAS